MAPALTRSQTMAVAAARTAVQLLAAASAAPAAQASQGPDCCAEQRTPPCDRRLPAHRTPRPAGAACPHQTPCHSAAPSPGGHARRARSAGRLASTCPKHQAASAHLHASLTAGSTPTRRTCRALPRVAHARPPAAPRHQRAYGPARASAAARSHLLKMCPSFGRPLLLPPPLRATLHGARTSSVLGQVEVALLRSGLHPPTTHLQRARAGQVHWCAARAVARKSSGASQYSWSLGTPSYVGPCL